MYMLAEALDSTYFIRSYDLMVKRLVNYCLYYGYSSRYA